MFYMEMTTVLLIQNESQSWNTDDPKLSRCFRQTSLSILPCLALLVLAPLEILISKTNPYPVSWSLISYTRFIVSGCLSLVSLIDLITFIVDHGSSFYSDSPADFFAPLIKFITFVSDFKVYFFVIFLFLVTVLI